MLLAYDRDGFAEWYFVLSSCGKYRCECVIVFITVDALRNELGGVFMPLMRTEHYTTDYIYNLPEGQRAELIDGQIYNMAPPSRIHQQLVSGFHYKIRDYIEKNHGSCEVYPAPFAVFLNADDKNYVEPDISIICDKDKLDEKGCNGAPDWIIEIVSPSSQRVDYGVKLFKYRSAGVREYWIVNPMKQTVQVYSFEGSEDSAQYSFTDNISVYIYEDLTITPSELLPE